jgi:hypothetical protein
MTWTPERDNILRKRWAEKKQSWEIADELGVSQKSVQGRAQRLGMRFERLKTRRKRPLFTGGHRPFTPRCAELLREAGVKI